MRNLRFWDTERLIMHLMDYYMHDEPLGPLKITVCPYFLRMPMAEP